MSRPSHHQHAELPAELREIAALLDRLGAAERASAGRALEASVAAHAAAASAEADPRARALSALASREAAAGGAGLEERVLARTAPLLSSRRTGLRLAGAARTEPRRWGTGRPFRHARLAATLLLGAGLALVIYSTSGPAARGPGTVPAVPSAVATLDRDIDRLLILAEEAAGDLLPDLSEEVALLEQAVNPETWETGSWESETWESGTWEGWDGPASDAGWGEGAGVPHTENWRGS